MGTSITDHYETVLFRLLTLTSIATTGKFWMHMPSGCRQHLSPMRRMLFGLWTRSSTRSVVALCPPTQWSELMPRIC